MVSVGKKYIAAVQISPMTKREQKRLNQAGKAG
jgi:hypothetical protein